MSMRGFRMLAAVSMLALPAAIQAQEWGPISGGGSGGTSPSCASESVYAFFSFEFNYDKPPTANEAQAVAAQQEGEVRPLSARRRNGLDFEVGYVELDTPDPAKKDSTVLLSMNYSRINFVCRRPTALCKIKVRWGGGMTYFGMDEAELGMNLKTELQIPLRWEGNVGLMLGAVYFRPDSDRDFTVFRLGFRLHKAARK